MNATSFCYNNADNDTKCISFSERSQLYILAISNAVLSVPTAATNALVIVAILTTSSLRTPSYLLLTSLAFSDLVVGLLGQSSLSALVFGVLHKQHAYPFFLFSFSLAAILTICISVLTITAISVDRFLAIRLKMRYRSIVTVKRTRCFVGIVWTIAVLNICQIFIVKGFGFMFGALCVCVFITLLFVIVFCFAMSFRALKIHCAQTQPQGNQQQPNSTTQSNAIDVLKYRKLLKTMVLVVLLTFICYLPLIVIFLMLLDAVSHPVRHYLVLITIMTLNSTLNPVIYITRMRDIRQACTRILKKILICK